MNIDSHECTNAKLIIRAFVAIFYSTDWWVAKSIIAMYAQTLHQQIGLLTIKEESWKIKKPLRNESEGLCSVGDTGFEPVTPCL